MARRAMWSDFPHYLVTSDFDVCFQKSFAVTNNVDPKLSDEHVGNPILRIMDCVLCVVTHIQP